MHPRPALVYTDPRNRGDVNEYLHDLGLYRYDDMQESERDLHRPVLERPILHRVMLYAVASQSRDALGDERGTVPAVFVADHLASLGPDRRTQAAVVGVLMHCGLQVHTDYQPLGGSWYVDQVRSTGAFPEIDALMHDLMDVLTLDEAYAQTWRDRHGGDLWVLPTALGRGWSHARVRALQLLADGLTQNAIAHTLSVEGYQNRHGAVRWYAKAVREAIEVRS